MISKEKILDLKTRKTIYNFILKYPGLHLRQLYRSFDNPESTVRYHIDYLEKRGFIIKKAEKGYIRFFVTDKIGKEEKILLTLLRNETSRNIIL